MAPTAAKSRKNDPAKEKPADKLHYDAGWRETVEAVAMAVVLALLFRAFIAEPFVIPTGSMAPTLMGRHKDVACPSCGYRYQANASKERNQQNVDTNMEIVNVACPICRFTQPVDESEDANHGSFSGDRIIVSKFAYDLAEPQRWDVIVFKFPGDAVQNYIKRLVGLPGETLRIVGGNVYARREGEEFHILRKPPAKLETLLQIVHDNDYQEELLLETVWPPRWRPLKGQEAAWKQTDDRKTLEGESKSDEPTWMRYHHVLLGHDDWEKVMGLPPNVRPTIPAGVDDRPGELVTDYYAYNAYSATEKGSTRLEKAYVVPHWVDDLALDATVQVQDVKGAILLDVVRAGVHHTCRIDVSTGEATLRRYDATGKEYAFTGDDGKEVARPIAKTSVRGKGTYRLRLSNVDHETSLWVNGSVVKFDGPTTYLSDELVQPFYSEEDGGDMTPVGVGLEGARAKFTHLRLLRDKYYIADNRGGFLTCDYDRPEFKNEDTVASIMRSPSKWASSGLFEDRQAIQFQLEADQFFPMGDNSPQSADARSWGQHHYVERDLLIGKAVVIYWPHSWNRPIPFFPNLWRMGFIR